jgi:hypothetical protein
MSCSCIFSEDDWDEVVKRCVECQYNFDKKFKKKRKSSVQLRINVSLMKREEIKNSCAII